MRKMRRRSEGVTKFHAKESLKIEEFVKYFFRLAKRTKKTAIALRRACVDAACELWKTLENVCVYGRHEQKGKK